MTLHHHHTDHSIIVWHDHEDDLRFVSGPVWGHGPSQMHNHEDDPPCLIDHSAGDSAPKR